jgi:hypothetical protein
MKLCTLKKKCLLNLKKKLKKKSHFVFIKKKIANYLGYVDRNLRKNEIKLEKNKINK